MNFSQKNMRRKSYIALIVTVTVTLMAQALLISTSLMTGKAFENYVHMVKKLELDLDAMYAQGLQQGQALRNILLDPSNPKAYRNLEKAAEKFRHHSENLIAIASEENLTEFQTEAGDILRAWEEEIQIRKDIISLVKSGRAEEGIKLLNTKGTPKWREYKAKILKLKEAASTYSEKILKETDAKVSRYTLLGGIGAVAGILIILGLLALLTGTWKSLGQIIVSLNQGSGQLSDVAGQVASSAQVLADGASAQAAAIEETSASLEEIASMTRQNADNAQKANDLMDHTDEVIETANQSVQEMGQSMEEISSSGEQTRKIIQTIDEIAFQTNLLSLNAAVEAARAGEAGAGFAVVAEEVRNLANRSAEAARNTATLIDGTIKHIHSGATLMKQTDAAFKEAVTSVGDVRNLVHQIASASKEQTIGIDQLNSAVQQLDQVVQSNAATAEETASASEELNAQASLLSSTVIQLTELVGRTKKEGLTPENSGGASFSGTSVKPAPITGKSPQQETVKSRAGSHGSSSAGTYSASVIPFDDDADKDFTDF